MAVPIMGQAPIIGQLAVPIMGQAVNDELLNYSFRYDPYLNPPVELNNQLKERYQQSLLKIFELISIELNQKRMHELVNMYRQYYLNKGVPMSILDNDAIMFEGRIRHIIIQDTYRLNQDINGRGIFYTIITASKFIRRRPFYISDYLYNHLVSIYNNILNDYLAAGYTYKYFMPVKTDAFIYQINVNNVRMEYDIAAAGIGSRGSSNVSSSVYNTLKSEFDRDHISLMNLKHQVYRTVYQSEHPEGIKWDPGETFIGWKKSEYVSALKESGMFEEIMIEDGNGRFIRSYPNLGKAIIRTQHSRPNIVLEKLTTKQLGYLYQYINSQRAGGIQFNFQKLCNSRYVDLPTMQRMLQRFLPPLYQVFINKSLKEICSDLSIRKQTMVFIPERGAAIKYRPGGRYEKEAAEELLPGSREEYKLNQLYQKYIDRCNDPELDKSEILFDMQDLDIMNLADRKMNKNQLCAIITKYLRDVLKYRFDDKGL
jgi:hypothetical protein